jgi:two-component system LytT family response regulator
VVVESLMRVVVVDDEEPGRDVLRARLGLVPDIEIIGEASDGIEAVELITSLRPDLVFLDIRMPGMSGLEVLRAVSRTYLPQVVFVTAYDEHALHAFELHAVDYLLKPVAPARLLAAIERARANHAQRELSEAHARLARLLDADERAPAVAAVPAAAPAHGGDRPVRRIVVREEGDWVLLRTCDIDALEAAGNYVRIVLGNRVQLVRGTLAEYERRLDPDGFIRIHRSTLVNADRVQRVSPQLHGDFTVTLEGGRTYRMSRTFKDRLLP